MVKAGAKLDRLVAEKIMGWEIWEHHNMGMVEVITEDDTFLLDQFKPSTYIEDAWEVIEKLQDEWSWEMLMYNKAKEVEVRIGNSYAVDKSVPLAICLAALKTIGMEEVTND